MPATRTAAITKTMSSFPSLNGRPSPSLKRMRHDGCGGLPVRAELLTGIEGASGRPVRRIVLVGG